MIPSTHRGWRKHFRRCGAVVRRAKELGLLKDSEIVSTLLDIDIAFKVSNIDLVGWLAADDLNFTHDFVGIKKSVNRVTKTLDGGFVPRFASLFNPPDDD